jgi:putative ABC transport system permease protein
MNILVSSFQIFADNIIYLGFIYTILALGVFIAFKILNVADLSTDTLFSFSGILSIGFIVCGVPPFLALILAVVCGCGIGYLNAALHVYLKLDPLMAGIIIMTALYTPDSLIISALSNGTLKIKDGQFTIFSRFESLMSAYDNAAYASKIMISGAFVIGIVLLMYWFFGTEVGLALRASGKNQEMSKAEGINTNKYYILGMMISSGLVALSGSLYAEASKTAFADTGRGAIVIGLAIIFLGDVIFGSKSFKSTLLSIVCGGLIYWVILNSIMRIPGADSYLYMLKAMMIAVVMVADNFKESFLRKRKIRKALVLSDNPKEDKNDL